MSTTLTHEQIVEYQKQFSDVQLKLDQRAFDKPLTIDESAILRLSCTNSTTVCLASIRKKLLTTEPKYMFFAPKIIRHMSPMLSKNSRFTSLDLSFTKISKKLWSTQLSNSFPAGLTHLDVSATGLDDDGSKILFQILQTSPQLTSLSLRNNKLTNHGTALLAATLASTKLRVLDVSQCGENSEVVKYALSATRWRFSAKKNITLGTTSIAWTPVPVPAAGSALEDQSMVTTENRVEYTIVEQANIEDLTLSQ